MVKKLIVQQDQNGKTMESSQEVLLTKEVSLVLAKESTNSSDFQSEVIRINQTDTDDPRNKNRYKRCHCTSEAAQA